LNIFFIQDGLAAQGFEGALKFFRKILEHRSLQKLEDLF